MTQDYAVQMLPSGKKLTKKDLIKRASQFARLLKSREVKRVAFLTEHRLECPELMLGARWAGVDYLFSGTDRLATGVKLSQESLIGIIEDFNPSMVIISDFYSDVAAWLSKELSDSKDLLMMGDKHIKQFEQYEAVRDQQIGSALSIVGNGELYPITGGSTGRPKVIKPAKRLDGKPYALQSAMVPNKDGAVLVTGSIFSNLGARTMLSALLVGARLVILEHWDERLFLQAVEKLKITHTSIVPAKIVQLLQIPPEKRKEYDVSSLKQVVHAGAACPDNIKRQLIDWLGDRVVEVYGTAERFGGTIIHASEWLRHPGSVGRPLPGCTITIRDSAGTKLPPGEKGVIWFKQDTEYTRMEYMGNTKEAAACYGSNGETTVKDIGYLDSDGYLFVTGREKRMVVVGGVNIYPESTEKVLGEHPDIVDVWVFGVPDVKLGERLCAFVRLRVGVTPTDQLTDALIELCKNKLGLYSTPLRVAFVDTLPRNDAGKIDAHQIKVMEEDFSKNMKEVS